MADSEGSRRFPARPLDSLLPDFPELKECHANLPALSPSDRLLRRLVAIVNTRLQPSRASDCARISAPRSGLAIPFLFHERSGVLQTLRKAESTCDSIAAGVGRCGQGCTARRSVRLDPLEQVPSYDDCSA
jgi:hypothetical protein